MTDLQKSPDFLYYSSEDKTVTVRTIIDNDTVWITAQSMADLFRSDLVAIAECINQIFATGELKKSKVYTKQKVQADMYKPGMEQLELYNLDMVIAVGYRINPYEATKFRLWAESLFTKLKISMEARKGKFANATGPIQTSPPEKKETNVTQTDDFSKMLKGLLNVPPPKKGS